MKKSLFFKAALTAMLLTFTLSVSSCSNDDDDEKSNDSAGISSETVVNLNEGIIKANAYLACLFPKFNSRRHTRKF